MFRSSARRLHASSGPNHHSGVTPRKAVFEHLEPRHLLAATPIEILAAGRSGQEQMQLQIDGVTVQTWNNVGGDYEARQFESFQYTHPTTVSPDRVRVVFTGGSGTENDLRVDGTRIGPTFFQSEWTTTFSSGTFDSSTGDCNPRFAQSEELHCLGGYFQYFAPSAVIDIYAAGHTGQETVALEIDGQQVATFENVGGNHVTGQFERLRYAHPSAVSVDQLRVVLVDGTNTPGGADRNVRIEAIETGGERYETDASDVFSVGAFHTSSGCDPGFKRVDTLHCSGGYFEFPDTEATGTQIDIRAAGATFTERMELRIDGVTVRTWDNVGGNYNNRIFDTFSYRHPTFVAANRVSVAFTNDGPATNGADRNLRVDGVWINGAFFESEAANVLSTGTFTPGTGCAPGFKRSETLHCNGELQFEAPVGDPGVIGIGSSQYGVGETDGFVTVDFARTDGSDGVATVDYTTVPATATPGVDYQPQSGTIVFADGQTTRSVQIPILNDALGEGTETFNLAIDLVTGAVAGQPRTTTISIFDDEQPTAGNGNGLRGEYFSGQGFGTLLLERTDVSVNFDWGGGSPAGSVPSDNFSVRWTGQIQPLFSETYTFQTTTDDGVRLWVNNQLIIDQFVDQPATSHFGFITLTAGVRYDLRMEYYENTGQASAQLRWSSPSQASQIVPTSQLFSEPVVPTSGTFSGETVVSGLTQPTAIDFAPTGQIFIAQKDGVVRVFENGQLVPGWFINISAEVNNVQDRGLLGLAVDPDFFNRPYIYLLYTLDPVETQSLGGLAGPDGAGNRVAVLKRVTADASNGYRTVVPFSDVTLLGENSVWGNISFPDRDSTNDVSLPPSCAGVQDCLPVDSRSHTVGALAFAPDGSLFVTNGDGTSFGRVDPRTVRVQDLDSLAGKVLRIDPDTGQGIPNSPFFQPGNPDSNRSKVYNYGLRNPFRLAVNPTTGQPYVGDVGWNTFEEINAGRGLNFGWPFYEGGDGFNQQTGGYRDLPEAAAFYANNNATPPLWSRAHSAGGVAIVVGDFYTGSLYPAQYQGALLFTDFGDPTIRALRLNPDGSVLQSLVVSGSVGTVVEMTMGPDGTMYYADLAAGVIGRLRFNASATAAVGVASASDDQHTLASAFASLTPLAPPRVAVGKTIADEEDGSSTYEQEFALLNLLDVPAGGFQRQTSVELRVVSPSESEQPLSLEIDEQSLDDLFASLEF